MVIAVDFDGTIVEHKYPDIGKPIPFAIETLLKLQKERHLLILWTVREGKYLQDAIDYCAACGLEFYAVNASYPEENRENSSRKLNVDLFIDDRNLGGLPDWGIIYNVIQTMLANKDPFAAMCSAQPIIRDTRKKNIFLRIGEMLDKR